MASTARIVRSQTRINAGVYHSGRPISISKASWASQSTTRDPFGAAMADEIFEVHYRDGEDYSPEETNYEYEDEDQSYQIQYDLPLESLEELEQKMRQQIHKFDRAYNRMMIYALNWHYLLEECEDDAQIEKMFKDMQMIRKLRGSDYV